LKGEQPFVQLCPNPQYDYYWGQSEVQRLVFLQDMRNKRQAQILELLDKQVSPPKAIMGFTGILDEKNFALNRAGGLLATDMPNARSKNLRPTFQTIFSVNLGRLMTCFQKPLVLPACWLDVVRQAFVHPVMQANWLDWVRAGLRNALWSSRTA
jgi:hypothetical protein